MKSQLHHIPPTPHPHSLRPIRLVRATPPALVEEERSLPAEDPMKCVWSGYPSHDRDCRSRIPASVVVKAWRREQRLEGAVEGFFYFTWRSGVWLAFGVEDGGVRGVYCPTHCSERDARETRDGAPAERPAGAMLQ